jgi:prevent-host-death family protein
MYKKAYERTHIPSIRIDKDLAPLSQFRARVADFVQQVTESGRPMLITLRRHGIIVLLDVREFELMRDQLESLDGEAAERALDARRRTRRRTRASRCVYGECAARRAPPGVRYHSLGGSPS